MDITGELVLDPSTKQAFVSRATDPVVSNVATPADFAAQYPTPLDVTEIIAMCEEISVWNAIPNKPTGLKQETWRELDVLAFTSGSIYIAFTDGACPEEYRHEGDNQTVDLKNFGVKKSLTISDIMHSQAVASANWNGINTLVGGMGSSSGLPGGMDVGTFVREHVANLKEKEIRLGTTLLLNGLDRELVLGNATTNPLEMNGIEPWFVNICSNEHTNDNTASGTFSQAGFDRFLSEGCARPTHIFGHPTAIQELMAVYFGAGFAAAPQQVINFADGNRIIPGYNFAGYVNTGVGRLAVVADVNFTRTNIGGGAFQSNLYALRMTHNGEPLVYKITQIPLALRDLAPGCTAISFEIWTKMALIIKNCCSHSIMTSQFNGRVGVSTCTSIG